MNFFLPKKSALFNLLKEMEQEHKDMVLLLVEFGNNFNNFETYSKRAKDIEHKADEKTHAIIDWLNRTFVTPIDREDIYLLTHEFDDIVDLIENAIHNIDLYGIAKKISAIDEFIFINKAISNVFKEEKDPIMVIKLKDILENLENVMDKYQKVSDIIESIVIKSS